MKRDELYEALDAWPREGLEQELWSRLGRERTVLVSDLSGFTRITRTRGILAFLAIFRQAEKIGEPLFARHGGRFLKTAADNLFALFDDPAGALACARAMLREAEKWNAGVPASEGHVKFCIGIAYGKILELDDDAFGDAVNVAFKLGEDIAEPGEILVSEEAARKLGRAADRSVEAGNVTLRYCALGAD